MSYHLTIIRTNGAQSIPITKEEVLSLPNVFPEWHYDAQQDALVSKTELNEAPALWFSDGELWTKNPSNETIASMISLAAHLGGRVRGDELETYSTAFDSYVHPDDQKQQAESKAARRALVRRMRWKQWALKISLIGGFIAAAFILKKMGFLE